MANPREALFYCESHVNFPYYFQRPLRDDLNYHYKRERRVFVTDCDIEPVGDVEFFVLNEFEKGMYDGGFEEVCAIGTSSPRTLYIPCFDCYAKTHFSGRISSNFRPISRRNIEDTLAATQKILENPGCPSILPEYGGAIWNSLGCIYRSIYPEPYFEGSFIPLHSLCGIDINANDPALFVQIAQEKSMNPEDFILYNVIRPLLTSWEWFELKFQQKATCHGQNVLIGFDTNLESRIIHRDIQAESYEPEDYASRIRMTRDFDFFIGFLLLDRIAEHECISATFVSKVKEMFSTMDISELLIPHRVYDQGVGHRKRTVILDKKPKYR